MTTALEEVTGILPIFEEEIEQFVLIMNKPENELPCELTHEGGCPVCSVHVTHKLTATCNHRSVLICQNGADYKHAVMEYVNPLHLCMDCQRPMFVCWVLIPV